jgi:hypothetical protein
LALEIGDGEGDGIVEPDIDFMGLPSATALGEFPPAPPILRQRFPVHASGRQNDVQICLFCLSHWR